MPSNAFNVMHISYRNSLQHVAGETQLQASASFQGAVAGAVGAVDVAIKGVLEQGAVAGVVFQRRLQKESRPPAVALVDIVVV